MIYKITKWNYVYRITNLLNHKIYIGCHQTDDLNDGYMGSGKYVIRAYEKYGIDNFIKKIIGYYPDAQSMFLAEATIVTREFINDDTNYNLAEGGRGGFKGTACYLSQERSNKISKTQLGRVMARNEHGNIIKVSKDDNRLTTKELVGSTKGMAVVKDHNGTIYQVNVNDPRIISGELVGLTKGLAVMKDSLGKRHQVQLDDPRIATGELVGNTKGSTQTLESNIKRRLKLKANHRR
jgi:hypothetical protein